MSKKIILSIMLLTTGFLLNTPSMAMQSESPVACFPAGTTFLVYGDHTTGCEINPSTDVDGFNFDGVAGDVIRISLRTAGQLDGRLELFGPSGLISDTACNAGFSGCSLIVNQTLTESGTFAVAISDSGSDITGTYTLGLERIPPVVTQPLAYGVSASDGISPSVDMDFFAFNAFAGNTVRITVRTTGQLDGRLEIYDPNGAVVIDTACNAGFSGCTVTTDQPLTEDGTYILAVSDSGIDITGTYDVTLTCLLGGAPGICPGVIPPRAECDIQMSQATYSDGDTITADVFRFANLTGAAQSLEWKVWLGVPGLEPIEVINLGADGIFVLPDGTDTDLGPLPLVPVTAGLPIGQYEFSCRFLDPTTGRLLMEDRNFFDILP